MFTLRPNPGLGFHCWQRKITPFALSGYFLVVVWWTRQCHIIILDLNGMSFCNAASSFCADISGQKIAANYLPTVKCVVKLLFTTQPPVANVTSTSQSWKPEGGRRRVQAWIQMIRVCRSAAVNGRSEGTKENVLVKLTKKVVVAVAKGPAGYLGASLLFLALCQDSPSVSHSYITWCHTYTNGGYPCRRHLGHGY